MGSYLPSKLAAKAPDDEPSTNSTGGGSRLLNATRSFAGRATLPVNGASPLKTLVPLIVAEDASFNAVVGDDDAAPCVDEVVIDEGTRSIESSLSLYLDLCFGESAITECGGEEYAGEGGAWPCAKTLSMFSGDGEVATSVAILSSRLLLRTAKGIEERCVRRASVGVEVSACCGSCSAASELKLLLLLDLAVGASTAWYRRLSESARRA